MFKTLFLQIDERTVYSAQRYSYLLSTTHQHSGRLAQLFLRYDKMFKTLLLQIEETTVYSAQATSLAQRVDTQVDWPNSFCDMTKYL
jgi:hypothetical protein